MTKRLITAAMLGCLAWGASITPASADPIYVDVEIAPPHIEEYPRTVYEGQPVYYYDGHWYSRRGPRWVYYREEPRPLVVYRESPRYRRHYEAPPRPRHERRYEERRHDDEHHHHHHRD
jgi:hypothetical protein